MRNLKPNRVATYLTALSGLAAAIAVPVANLDTTSTAGVLGGLAAILAVAYKWLDGWQHHEAQVAAATVLSGLPAATSLGVVDSDDDGDDLLDGELAGVTATDPAVVPPDEIDQPEQTQTTQGKRKR